METRDRQHRYGDVVSCGWEEIGSRVALTAGIAELRSAETGETPVTTRADQAPQHFLYFLPLPQGHGSLRPTFSPERTTCWTCMSPAPAMRACSSSFFFLRWKASSISSTEVATWRGGRPLAPRPPGMIEGTPASGPWPDRSFGLPPPPPGLAPWSGGRSMICIRYR